jgi:hypothetical protein
MDIKIGTGPGAVNRFRNRFRGRLATIATCFLFRLAIVKTRMLPAGHTEGGAAD